MSSIKEDPDRSLVNGESEIETSTEQKKAYANDYCDTYPTNHQHRTFVQHA